MVLKFGFTSKILKANLTESNGYTVIINPVKTNTSMLGGYVGAISLDAEDIFLVDIFRGKRVRHLYLRKVS